MSPSNRVLLRSKKQNCVQITVKTGQKNGNIEFIEGIELNSQGYFTSYLPPGLFNSSNQALPSFIFYHKDSIFNGACIFSIVVDNSFGAYLVEEG